MATFIIQVPDDPDTADPYPLDPWDVMVRVFPEVRTHCMAMSPADPVTGIRQIHHQRLGITVMKLP